MNDSKRRRNGIDRFNVATSLTDDRKFIAFKRALKADEAHAYLYLVRFFAYMAQNHAFKPQLNPEESEVIADFCYFQDEPASLIVALQIAGFLTADLAVSGWFDHQPLAELIHKKAEAGSKGGKATVERHGESRQADGTFAQAKQDSTQANAISDQANSEGNSEEKVILPSKASDARESLLPEKQNGNSSFAWVKEREPEIHQLAQELLAATGATDKQDRKDLAWDVYHCAKTGNEQIVYTLIAEIALGEHDSVENIVAATRARLKQAYSP